MLNSKPTYYIANSITNLKPNPTLTPCTLSPYSNRVYVQYEPTPTRLVAFSQFYIFCCYEYSKYFVTSKTKSRTYIMYSYL